MNTFLQWLIRIVRCDMEYFEEETKVNEQCLETVQKTVQLKKEKREGD